MRREVRERLWVCFWLGLQGHLRVASHQPEDPVAPTSCGRQQSSWCREGIVARGMMILNKGMMILFAVLSPRPILELTVVHSTEHISVYTTTCRHHPDHL